METAASSHLPTLYCLTGLFTLMLLCGAGILIAAIWRAGDKEPAIIGRLTAEGNAVRIVALFLILMAVALLTSTQQLNESVTALFSAIGGFVLGGMTKKSE